MHTQMNIYINSGYQRSGGSAPGDGISKEAVPLWRGLGVVPLAGQGKNVMSYSSSDMRICACGDTVRMWTTWTRMNHG